jgi:hypothetical protein
MALLRVKLNVESLQQVTGILRHLVYPLLIRGQQLLAFIGSNSPRQLSAMMVAT